MMVFAPAANDEDGYFSIIGRIKEQYKLENGKFCFPVSLEEEIGLVPYVQQSVVYDHNIFPPFLCVCFASF